MSYIPDRILCRAAALACALLLQPVTAQAQSTRISENQGSVSFDLAGQTVAITRQGPSCPPKCLQPLHLPGGAATLGELELLAFLQSKVGPGRGLLVDVRQPSDFAARTLPGAVNVPLATLRPDNQYRDDLLAALGARNGDFASAYDLAVFADGADSAEAAEALEYLRAAGYPAGKLNFYRGGLRAWVAAGLTTATGQ